VAQRGFTLIELMVALVVSSLLVGMIFAIFIRMSTAYRGQQQVAEVQSKLAAARARIELDVKLAGLRMADGFYLAPLGSGIRRPALRVINNADAPDELELFYADPAVQVAVTGNSPGPSTCTRLACDQLTPTDGLVAGDLVVMSTPRWVDLAEFSDGAKVAQFEACVLQVASVGPNQLAFSTSPPWGTPDNSFCPGPPHPGVDPNRGKTVFYKLAARRWRIDPARPAEGVLQLSTLGALTGADDWQDQAYGFTDLQIATRFYEPGDQTETADPDLDPARDWYSGEAQELATAPAAVPAAAPVADVRAPLQISISLVARTERDVEGIASAATPSLTVAGNEQHNTVGDRAAIPLPSVLPALAGHRIYRYTTFQLDLRNLGVGR
jgi:prepilin-type N-terminal cleavage/methylation domain-containing protein